jgi:23S rRNA (adenine2503-C2)-methyltransferase
MRRVLRDRSQAMSMKAGISSEDPGRPRLEAGPYGAVNVLDLNREDLRSLFPGEPYRGDQVFSWVFAKGLADFSDMTTLPKSLRESMASSMRIAYPDVARPQVSRDGTEKFAYRSETADSESVLIFREGHWSVCVSSQAGCAMGCRFCKTAELGFTRNLTRGEIVSQVLCRSGHIRTGASPTSSFMGMGEPLMNYGSVVKAANILMDGRTHISKRRLTISTCGIVPALTRLPETPSLNRRLSKRARTTRPAHPSCREQEYPIDTLMAALRS